jgi:hypothetical protein
VAAPQKDPNLVDFINGISQNTDVETHHLFSDVLHALFVYWQPPVSTSLVLLSIPSPYGFVPQHL